MVLTNHRLTAVSGSTLVSPVYGLTNDERRELLACAKRRGAFYQPAVGILYVHWFTLALVTLVLSFLGITVTSS